MSDGPVDWGGHHTIYACSAFLPTGKHARLVHEGLTVGAGLRPYLTPVGTNSLQLVAASAPGPSSDRLPFIDRHAIEPVLAALDLAAATLACAYESQRQQ